MPGVTSFVCSMYGFTTSDINEARYKAFIRMSGGDEKYPLATIKKSNCASLPPCNKTLGNHVKRAKVVSMMLWKRANQTDPIGQARPTEYGWKENNNRLEPDRFPGRSDPEIIGTTRRDDATTRMDDDVSTHADDERTEPMTPMTTLTTWTWWIQHPRTTNSRVPGERTAMTVPTKIRRATFEDVKTYTHVRQSNILNRKRPDYRRTVRNAIMRDSVIFSQTYRFAIGYWWILGPCINYCLTAMFDMLVITI